ANDFSRSISNLNVVGNDLYFEFYNQRPELWKSDGTTAGTMLVKEFHSGVFAGSTPGRPTFVDFHGLLYFVANDGVHGNQIWTTDGLPQDTVPFDPGAFTVAANAQLMLFHDQLYFSAHVGADRDTLWHTDGTIDETASVDPTGNQQSPFLLAAVNDTLYFTAPTDPTFQTTHTIDLYATDGSVGGVTLMRTGFPSFSSFQTVGVSGLLFFSAQDGSSFAQKLWVSDGTALGTREIQPAESPSSVL